MQAITIKSWATSGQQCARLHCLAVSGDLPPTSSVMSPKRVRDSFVQGKPALRGAPVLPRLVHLAATVYELCSSHYDIKKFVYQPRVGR